MTSSINWNRCLLCSSSLKKQEAKSQSDNILIKYLLNDHQLATSLSRDVLEISRNGKREGEVAMCDLCAITEDSITQLLQQLENTQKKIVDKLRTVRKAVIDNSRLYGVSAEVKQDFLTFEKKLKEKEESGESSDVERRLLDVMHNFQTFVFENDLTSFPSCWIRLTPYTDEIKEEPLLDYFDVDEDDNHTDSDLDDDMKMTSSADQFPAEVEDQEPPQRSSRKPAQAAKAKLSGAFNNDSNASSKSKKGSPSQATLLHRQLKKEAALTKRNVKKPKGTNARKIRAKWQCQHCAYKTIQGLFLLEYHLRKHESPEKLHSCPDCKIQYSTKQALEVHLGYHVAQKKCDVCNTNVPFVDMASHVTTQHGKLYSCPCCTHCFGKFENLARHASKHSGLSIKCGLCPENETEEYQAMTQLHRHLFERHGCQDKQLKCNHPGCESVFYSSSTLSIHQKLHSRTFACSSCDKAFNARKLLDLHIRSHHPDQVKSHFCCDIDTCPAKFVHEKDLTQHKIEEHGQQSQYKCQQCDKQFMTNFRLQTHIHNYHPPNGKPRYECSQCSKKFWILMGLREHEALHSGVKEFTCEVCGFAAYTKSSLRNHMKRHYSEDEKKHECSYCGKKFGRKDCLRIHSRIHTLEKPYQCDIYGAAFNQQGTLRLHKRKHANGTFPRGGQSQTSPTSEDPNAN